MKSFRKGQAALEFLTTYGWAFLVILVMIGGLSYFGVFDFKSKLPDSCTFSGNSVECVNYQLNNGSSNQVQLSLKNIGEKSITITSVDVLERSLKNEDNPYCNFSITPGVQILPSNTADIRFSTSVSDLNTCGFYSNEKGTFDMILRYTVGSSSISTALTGTLTTTVIEG